LRTAFFDIETDGLLDAMTRVHCLVIRTADGEVVPFREAEIQGGLRYLDTFDLLIGHNAVEFDVPALQKRHPGWRPAAKLRDTLVSARLIWPDVKDQDFARARRGCAFPMRYAGRHSLAAWGHRLGVYKGDFGERTDWAEFSEEMLAYCVQDTLVTAALWEHILATNTAEQAFELEHAFAARIAQQERNGFLFDVPAAERLAARLQARRAELDTELSRMIPAFEVRYRTPKRQIEKTKIVPFNVQSRDHIAKHLIERRGWKPSRFTPEGKPQVDEAVLAPLEWPEAKLLDERFMVQKRLAQLIEGKQAWLSLVKPDGRIHGRVNHNGAVTGRCTHSGPNVAQVPANRAPYGKECRALFKAAPGFLLVGADAKGLELRCFAHYLAMYDEGAYIQVVTTGDPHTVNQEAAGLPTRDAAKTFIYAFLYGAGDEKLGSIVGKGERQGKLLKQRFMARTPGLKRLKLEIAKRVRLRGKLRGLDGRWLTVRSAHAALNTLLQSAGAIVMKQATVIFHELMEARGFQDGREYRQVAHIHDEIQAEVRDDLAPLAAELAVQAIRDTAARLGFRCPLDGDARIGNTWAATH